MEIFYNTLPSLKNKNNNKRKEKEKKKYSQER